MYYLFDTEFGFWMAHFITFART